MNDVEENMEDEKGKEEIPCVQRVSAVLWPSFIAAGIANSLFFTFFEPQALLYAGGYPEISNTGAYSIGFFLDRLFFILVADHSILGNDFILRKAL
jgi:hypothetical protein